MSTPPHRMTTRAKNAAQHPGYVQRKPRQPADPKSKSKKVEREATKAVKAVAKKLGAERLAKFEQETMERDVLNTTPHPNFTPAAGCVRVPASEPSVVGSSIESEVDTNEMNPDKSTYKQDPTTEEDTDNQSVVFTSSPRRTYAKVASPKRKSGVASGAKAAGPAPTGLKAAQFTHPSNSTTAYDSVPPSPPQATKATKTGSRTHPTTMSKRKAADACLSDSAIEPDSLPAPTPSALTLSPKTPAPMKKVR